LSERATVRVRLGPFEVEAAGQDQKDLEQYLRAGLMAAKTVMPMLQEVEAEVGGPRWSGGPNIRPSSDETAARQHGVGEGTSPSIGEVLKEARINTETDRCIAIAAFLFRNGLREFTHRDALKAYDEAGCPHPTNIYDVLNRLVKKAHLRPSGDREGVKSFSVTRTGLDYAESLMSPDS